jgi:molecular chaperone GrpE
MTQQPSPAREEVSEDDPAEGPRGPGDVTEEAEEQPAEASGNASGAGLADALEAPPDDGAAEAFHKRARLAEDRLAEVLGAYRKLKTETDAYKERLTRNIERRYDQRRERLLLKFIDILDNLDRALEAAESSYAGEALIQGLILVRTQLLQTLQEEGLERIPVMGLPYDPNFSEAVGTEPVSDPEHHHVVIKDLLRGYRLNGRIARASRVIVGEYRGEMPVSTPEGAEAPTEPLAAAPEASPPGAEDEEKLLEPSELSLEEIIARAEAQEALFPDAFHREGGAEDEDQKT